MTQWIRTFFARLRMAENQPPWRMADVLSTAAVMLAAFFLVGPMLATLLFAPDLNTPSITAVLVGWLIGGLVTAGYIGLIQRYDRDALRLGKTALPLTFMLLLGLAIAITLDLVSFAVADTPLLTPELAEAALFEPVHWILALLFLLLVQPVAEELVFRAILLPTLRASFGAWPGLLSAAGLYGLFHLLAYTPPDHPHGYLIALPFLVGLILSAARVYTQSTRAVIVLHMALGLFAILKAFAVVGS